MLHPHLLVILALLSISVVTQPRLPKEIRDQLLVNEKGLCADEQSLKATWVDLNGDRIPEIIVKVENSCHCDKQRNCDVKVFEKSDVGYKELFAMPDTYKLSAKETVTKGYKDLVIEGVMDPENAALIVFKWNGLGYEISSCWSKENIGQGKPVWKTSELTCPGEALPKPQRQSSRQSPQRQPIQTARLTPQAFTIPAGNYLAYPFGVRNSGTIYGRFEATGGTGNDIEVMILGQDEFTNWKNGHTVNTWYNAGRLTVSNISVQLPTGMYYLVFSNTFSVLTPKAVTANIFLRPN